VTYRFTRFWATVLVVTGSAVIVIGVVAALAVAIAGPDITRYAPTLDPRVGRVVATMACAMAGLLVGAPLIVLGQVLDAFLDQRDLLARIHRRLRRKRARVTDDDRTRLFPSRTARR
jgi:hypothetical protein